MEYLKFLKWISPFMTFTSNIEGDGSGGGDDDKGGEKVDKAEFDKIVGEKDKIQKEADDVRAEIFTPEYLAYLDSMDKPSKLEDKKPEIGDDVLEKMSKKEILELATKNAVDKIQATIDADKKSIKAQSDASVQREIKKFASTHTDYEKYRPVMYGLSLKPECKDMRLQELYDLSKTHVKSLQEGPTEEEKKKERAMSGMKPENSSGTYSFDKRVDADTAAKEAADEVASSLGPIPSA